MIHLLRSRTALVAGVFLAVMATVGILLWFGAREPSRSSPAPPTSATSATEGASAGASLNAELLDRRWTVLFVGIDLNAAREAAAQPPNADAIMLVSLSADGTRLALVSLPRDTVDVPLPDGSTYARKVNALYGEAGIEGLVGAMEALFGVPIDGYAGLHMDDFTALVDAVGGVEVSPAEPLRDPIVRLDLEAGPQEIDAATANGYVRTRVDQDYGRMARQQEVLLAIVERLVAPGTDLDVRALLDGLESLETDLPLDDVPTLLELARRATEAEVTRLLVEPPLITFEGDRGDGRGYVLEPDVEAIREAVGALIGAD